MHPRRLQLALLVSISLLLLGMPRSAASERGIASRPQRHLPLLPVASQRFEAMSSPCPTELLFGVTIQCAITGANERDRFGQLLSSTLDFPAEFKTYTITAPAGSNVHLEMTRRSGMIFPRLRLYSPAGIQLCSAFTSAVTAEISTCTLPNAGSYTILADDTYGTHTGSYTIALRCLNQACGLVLTYLPLIRAPDHTP